MITTRFAPSPTGKLHLGHAYAAKVAYDLANVSGSRFLVRFEDIDHTRVRPEYYGEILKDLEWLGFSWNGEPWRQKDRFNHYEKALEQLKEMGVVYPCYCTRREVEEELTHLVQAPQGPEGPLYPGTCRALKCPPNERDPSWRLDTKAASHIIGDLSFHDTIHGKTSVNPTFLGDVILARKDIGTSYHLAVVVDDAAQEITHVTRGEDLLPSTHVHRILQSLLGLPEPKYLHHKLVTDQLGKRLAKRNDALSIASLRKEGLSANLVKKMAHPDFHTPPRPSSS
ncbi:MAG: tRNA glutamyl-Q(34) synthetase GluQRS [Akkermansiaceae bacterium]|nr:tRNA glutamyl-Q(34) synthetase GluQRS [Akkermansiaceae bacterium]